jgi:hypothetical protein
MSEVPLYPTHLRRACLSGGGRIPIPRRAQRVRRGLVHARPEAGLYLSRGGPIRPEAGLSRASFLRRDHAFLRTGPRLSRGGPIRPEAGPSVPRRI